MTDDQLLRYSRHILLEAIGIEGQERLLAARVLVVGAGGLGSPVALYLASAGVGTLTIVDDDRVDLTNLQRQIVHAEARIGWRKVDSAAAAIAALNPGVTVVAVPRRTGGDELSALVGAHDLVVDCSDNLATRHAVNAACVALGRPLVAGAAIGFDGQMAVFDTRDPSLPCYACIFPPGDAVDEARCATFGVFAPLVGIIGSQQAAEALKLLCGIGTPLAGRLQMLDARSMEWTEVRTARAPNCSVCAQRPPARDAAADRSSLSELHP